MALKLKNNAVAQLASTFNIGAVSFTVAAGQGARFPTLGVGDYTYVTLEDAVGNVEIVKVTIISGDTFGGITRAQDGTTERNWSPSGVIVECRLCTAVLQEFALTASHNTWTGNQTFNGDVAAGALTKAEPKTDNATSLGTTVKRWVNLFLSGVVRWGSGANTVALGAEVSTDGAKTVVLPAKSGTVALLDSPTFTGAPKAPTPNAGDSTTRIATTAFVQASASATGKKSLWISGFEFLGRSGAWPINWADVAGGDANVSSYRFFVFPDSVTTEASVCISLPKSWDKGTLTFRLYLKQDNFATSGNALFNIHANALGNNDSFGLNANFITVTAAVPALGNLIVTPETAALAVAGSPQDHDMILVKVVRTGAAAGDTIATTVNLLGLMVYYNAATGNDN